MLIEIHPFFSFIMLALTIISLVASKFYAGFIFMFLAMILALIQNIDFHKVVKSIKYIFILCFSVFILNIIYPNSRFLSGDLYKIFFWNIDLGVLTVGIKSFVKLFSLSLISVIYSSVIDFNKLILFFMSKKILPVKIGYPVLIALNSISLILEEKKKIDMALMFRNSSKKISSFSKILPLLVFAIRHSQRGAMALIARGLNENKEFHCDYTMQKVQKILSVLLIIIFIFLILYY